MNSHEIGRYCEKFNAVLWSDDQVKDLFLEAASTVERVAQGNYYRDHIHTETFTQSLKTAIDQRSTPWAPTPHCLRWDLLVPYPPRPRPSTSASFRDHHPMPLKPWYKVVTPREDLREGKPLDASEFAAHLDDVRNGSAPPDYQKPDRFFARTYLTKNLSTLASQVIRRLSGERTETSAVFNLVTQFGGGKIHALTLLYHLARLPELRLEQKIRILR